MGWNIWNPKEVYSELIVAPDEDKTKVDIALFSTNYFFSVFIEIKFLEKISEKLTNIERQLRNYNRNNNAIFSIITDGRIWRFYYALTGGEFAQKFFKQIDILTDDLDDIELHFLSFLNKEEIDNGNAENEAKKYLALNQKQKAMEDSILQARRIIQEPPYPSLPECLIKLVHDRGIIINMDEAIDYIKTSPSRKAETQENINKVQLEKRSIPIQQSTSVDDLTFTKIINGRIEQHLSNSWNELLRYALILAFEKGSSLKELNNITTLNIKSGLYNERGFKHIKGLNISMQEVPTNKVANNLKKITQYYKLEYEIEFQYQEKSPFAGKKGFLKN